MITRGMVLRSGRREAVLRFIAESIEENGWPPSVREIGEACGMPNSTAHVDYYLNKLVDAGLIYRAPYIQRGIRLTSKGREALERTAD